ncbi:hypothetical protein MCERE19_03156 [Spirosomataceae bacterium]
MNTILEKEKANHSEWFGELVRTLQVDEVCYDSQTLSPEKRDFYDNLFSGNIDKITSELYDVYRKRNVLSMVSDFVNNLKTLSDIELYLDINGNEILAWVIAPDESDIEKPVFSIEATYPHKQAHLYQSLDLPELCC